MIPFWQNKDGTVKNAKNWKRPGAKFHKKIADLKVQFIESHCRHVKGELAGQLLKLEPWERELVRGIFGWIRPNGTRLFREVYVEVPKKNGKSTLAAAIGDAILLTEKEPGAEIYSVAAETEQANIIFSIAKDMIQQDPILKQRTESFRRSIRYKDHTYQVLSADADTKEGKNSHAVLFDELHVQPGRELYDNLKTGMAARRQPLMIMFTTAGFDRKSFCWEMHQKAISVLRGTNTDAAFLPMVFGANVQNELDGGGRVQDIDWTSPRVWKLANPNYGISVKVDYLREECENAKRTPTYENTFKRKHLNIWTQQETRWLQMAEWDACAGFSLMNADDPITWRAKVLEQFRGRTCFGGLDLATTTDIAALALVFGPQNPVYEEIEAQGGSTVKVLRMDPLDPFIALPWFWIPEDSMTQRVKRDGVPYDVWQRQGFLEATPGNRIDYRYIMLQLGKIRAAYDLKMLAFDRWGSDKIVTDLCDGFGFTLDQDDSERTGRPLLFRFGQGFQSMSAPTKELLNFILGRNIAHGANPVLSWMAGNVVVKSDSAENLKPDKGRSTEKIDGIVALIMALQLAIRFGAVEESLYVCALTE